MIDPHKQRVYLEKGGSISFDRLLLSTGSRPRQLSVPFAAVSSLNYLQSLDDAKLLKSRLKTGATVAVIGGGYVGLEVASTASEMGCNVVDIDQATRLLQRSVIPEVSEHMLQLHRSKGVVVRLGVTIARLGQFTDACRLHLSDETMVDADTAVVGIGSVPNIELAEAIGLHVEDGIRVDPSMRCVLNLGRMLQGRVLSLQERCWVTSQLL